MLFYLLYFEIFVISLIAARARAIAQGDIRLILAIFGTYHH